MSKTTELTKLPVTKLPIVSLKVDTKRKDLFHLQSIIANKEDSKNADVLKAVANYSNNFKLVKAKDEKIALKMHNEFLNDIFTVIAKEDKKADQKEEKPKSRRGKAKADKKDTNKKADSKKAEAKKEEKQPKKEKVLATFNHFCESSKVKCLELSKENAKTVALSLRQFERYNKSVFNDIPDADQKEMYKSENIKAIDSLINRNSIRVLIEEKDKKNKVVAQYLLRIVYVSPYSFLCVSEAHNRNMKAKTSYEYIINSLESEYTCYDAIQFNPLLETLTTTPIEKTDNKIEYKFVNIVVE